MDPKFPNKSRRSVFARLSGFPREEENRTKDDNENENEYLPFKRSRRVNHNDISSLQQHPTSRGSDLRDVLDRSSRVKPYQFNVENNVVISSANFGESLSIPSAAVEYKRSRVIRKLFHEFSMLCQHELDITPPKNVFYRWLVGMVTSNKHEYDPILRDIQSAVTDNVIKRELLSEIPCRIRAYSLIDSRLGIKTLKMYVSKARTWLALLQPSDDLNKDDISTASIDDNGHKESDVHKFSEVLSNKGLLQKIDDILKQTEHRLSIGFQDDQALINSHLSHLRDNCTQLFTTLVETKLTDRVAQVNSVCQRFATLAEEARDKVLAFAVQETCIRSQVSISSSMQNENDPNLMDIETENNHEDVVLDEHDEDQDEDGLDDEGTTRESIRQRMNHFDKYTELKQNDASVTSLSNDDIDVPDDSILCSTVTLNFDNISGYATVSFANDKFVLPVSVANRLQELYGAHSDRHKSGEATFEKHLYLVLRRYATMMGGLPALNAAAFEAPLPPSVMETLNEEMGVCFELCSSPLNTYFLNYCSAFPDTDGVFGSIGGFQEMSASAGVFECHPPCTQEAIDRAADHVNTLLSKASGSFTVVFISPNWVDPPSAGLCLLSSSRFNRSQFLVPRLQHAFVDGVSFLSIPSITQRRNVMACFDSIVLILQNDSAFENSPILNHALQRIKRVFGVH